MKSAVQTLQRKAAMTGAMTPDDEYPPTGVPEIDREHRDLGAALGALARDPSNATAQAARAVLSLLVEHFENEERMMIEIGYPDLARHRRSHRDFLEDARSALDPLPPDASALEWVKRTRRWMPAHVISEDLWLGLALNDARHWAVRRKA